MPIAKQAKILDEILQKVSDVEILQGRIKRISFDMVDDNVIDMVANYSVRDEDIDWGKISNTGVGALNRQFLKLLAELGPYRCIEEVLAKYGLDVSAKEITHVSLRPLSACPKSSIDIANVSDSASHLIPCVAALYFVVASS